MPSPAQKLATIEVAAPPEDHKIKQAEAAQKKAQEQLDATEAELQHLEKVADDSDEAAILAEREFQADPTAERFSAKSVAEQLAKNAAAKAKAFKSDLDTAKQTVTTAERRVLEAREELAEVIVSRKLETALRTLSQAIREYDAFLLERRNHRILLAQLGLGPKGLPAIGAFEKAALEEFGGFWVRSGGSSLPNRTLSPVCIYLASPGKDGDREEIVIRRPPGGMDHSPERKSGDESPGPEAA